jgi:septum formation protein
MNKANDSMPPLILASSSPFRRKLLATLNIEFSVEIPAIDETARDHESASDLVTRLSEEKALAVATKRPDALVIGSDQVALLGQTIMGKPKDHAHAVEQLQRCSGNTLKLFTGLALVGAGGGKIQSHVEPFEVEFRNLDTDTIERYLRTEQPYQCCGSLRAEGLGISLLTALRGNDPNALIGLPLIALVDMLHNQGITLP